MNRTPRPVVCGKPTPSGPCDRVGPHTSPCTTISADIAAEAARATEGGFRRPMNCLPANPSVDHQVAYALGDVADAVRRAVDLGATQDEMEAIIYRAITRRSTTSVRQHNV